MQDDLVRATNDDALHSRVSAIQVGYVKDEFSPLLLKGRLSKRAPIINRGTWLRTVAIDRLVDEFVESHSRQCQIISLGAGSDSRYFTLKSRSLNPARYVELDFGEITGKKAMAIYKNKRLKDLLPSDVTVENGGQDLVGSDYWLIAGDLRDFGDILTKLESRGLDKSLPTLFLSECVLIYLDTEVGDSIVCKASSFPLASFVTYEQIMPDDPFGKTMLSNLKLRGLSLLSIHSYPTLQAQEDRYKSRGWMGARSIDIFTYWKDIITSEEKERVAKLELFDEVEEFNLLNQHYCLTVASTTSTLLTFR